MADLSRDVEAYAALAAALTAPGAARAALLAAHGLDEDGWEALDDAWQARFSEAEDDDALGVPALLGAYAEAFSRAQLGLSPGLLSFERFLEAAREMRRGNDMATVLKRLDLTLESYLQAQAHWTARMLHDEELAAKFQRVMR
jgi:hypothetical protein